MIQIIKFKHIFTEKQKLIICFALGILVGIILTTIVRDMQPVSINCGDAESTVALCRALIP